jgi:hypothetical protein
MKVELVHEPLLLEQFRGRREEGQDLVDDLGWELE